MSTAAAALPSAQQIAWQRRRRSLASAWRDYRHDRAGMAGLGDPRRSSSLMALAAPLLADEAGLRAVNADGQPGVRVAVASSARSAPTTSGAAS